MHPFYLFGTAFGMRLIQLHPLHRHVLHTLAMMRLGAMSGHALEAMDRLDLHSTNVRRPFIADAPALTFQEPFHSCLGELATGHQGPLAFGELSVACRAAQPFDVFVRACPRPMHNVPFTGTIKARTLWIWTREASISLLRWRR
jgi:hypothetical protein